MSDALVRAHIEGEHRLRDGARAVLKRIWEGLPAYDRANLDQWLSEALPVVEAAQRQSAALTNAYLAASLERQPIGVDTQELIGAAVRNGTPPSEVYERPFITVWTALGKQTPWEQAVADGMARAMSSAAMDVQLSMRATADAVDLADPNIYGYKRVANANACPFCKEVDGAYVKGSAGYVMALHSGCNCSVVPNTEPHRGAVKLPDGTEIRPYAFGPLNDNVAVREHGELGPVLVDPKQHFTSEAELVHAH